MKLVKKLTTGFTITKNEIIQCKTLSLKARGLYALMLSLPDDWNFSVGGLQTFSGIEKRDAIATAMRELEAHGLVTRTKYQNSRGHWRIDYFIYDEIDLSRAPHNPDESPISDSPLSDNPQENTVGFTGHPSSPLTDNPIKDKASIYKEINNKEINNNIINNIITAFGEIDPKNKGKQGDFGVRATCKKLLEAYGEENVIQAIQVVKKAQDNPPKYFPTITSPYDLLDKWGKLKGFFNIRNQEVKELEEKKAKMLRAL